MVCFLSSQSIRVSGVTMTNVPQLMQEIQDKLAKGEVECLICIDIVRGSAPIWSCSNCYSIFHLKCIKKWARAPTSVDLSVEKNQSGNWRCPGCQSVQQLTAKEIRYVCFCGKQPDPPMDLYRTPHSCGEPCGKPLGREVAGGGGDGNDDDRCPHVCVIQCHPGPCPPCDTFTARACHCGKMAITTKCSDRKSMRITCEEPCNKLLECGRHRCERFCHHGPCDPCPVLIKALCFCNKKEEFLLCGEIVWKDDVGRTDGIYSCNSSCGQKLACGKHFCGENCHPGLCGDCKLTTCSQICVNMSQPKNPKQYDAFRFCSVAEAQYPWYQRKRVEVGRFVNLPSLALFDVENAFRIMGWLPVTQYHESTCPELVKHFYCNLQLEGDPEDLARGRELRITSWVKGVPISFDTQQLVELLNISNAGELVYCAPRERKFLTEVMRAEVSRQILRSDRWEMRAINLRSEPRVYCKIIQHNLVPQSGHYDTVSQLTQYLIYSICTRQPVCLPYIIIRTMHRATTPGLKGNLPYGRLVTTLLTRLYVNLEGERFYEDSMSADLDWDAICRMEMQGMQVSDEERNALERPLGRVATAAATFEAVVTEGDGNDDRMYMDVDDILPLTPQHTTGADPF
ncbi:hypothetical protein NE237_006930 [Protea cynaroides]|uniref:RING-type domain-containing protein n=1 Tax=Protea cynaroides TaxID=273540 RepID=A0A9Q0KP07_9MAGN|nr:hypothetical protein NE237_006930 [Protea cynaroides]